jgi:hypothetical protein
VGAVDDEEPVAAAIRPASELPDDVVLLLAGGGVAGTGAAPGVLVTSGLAAGRPMVGAEAAGRAGGDAGWVEAPPAATARAAAASAAFTVEPVEAGGRGDVGAAPFGRVVPVVPDVPVEPELEEPGEPDAPEGSVEPVAGFVPGDVDVEVDEAGFVALDPDDEPEPDEEFEPGLEPEFEPVSGEADDAEPVDDEPLGVPVDGGRSPADVTAVVDRDVPGRSDPRVVSGRGLSSDELTHHLRGRTSGHDGMSSG